MKLVLTPSEGVALHLLIKDSRVEKIYQELIKTYMDIADATEDEAKRIIGPEWVKTCVGVARKMAKEAV